MQTFIEFVVSLMAVLFAAILAQAGVDTEPRHHESREIHRTTDCSDQPDVALSTTNQDC